MNKPNPKTAAVNRSLFEDLRRHEQAGNEPGAIRARKSLVEANLGLIYWYANRYRWVTDEGRMEMGDLVGGGVIGMYKAIDKFDVSRGFTFSTYAQHWIRSYVDRAAQGGDMIHINHGWLPRGSMRSLDAPVSEEHGSNMTLHEVIDSHVETPEAVVADRNEVEAVSQACHVVGGQMGERASVAMFKRFRHGQTYREIATDEGVTWQCIHYRENRFVERVRERLRRTG